MWGVALTVQFQKFQRGNEIQMGRRDRDRENQLRIKDSEWERERERENEASFNLQHIIIIP